MEKGTEDSLESDAMSIFDFQIQKGKGTSLAGVFFGTCLRDTYFQLKFEP